MKKFEYKVLFISDEIGKIRNSPNPRSLEPDHVLYLEIVNKEGRDGWRLTNPNTVVSGSYFEREYEARD